MKGGDIRPVNSEELAGPGKPTVEQPGATSEAGQEGAAVLLQQENGQVEEEAGGILGALRERVGNSLVAVGGHKVKEAREVPILCLRFEWSSWAACHRALFTRS